MTYQSPAQIAKLATQEARTEMAEVKRRFSGHHVHGGVAVVLCDDSGRVGEPEWTEVRDLTGKRLQAIVDSLIDASARWGQGGATKVAIQGSINTYDSFYDFVNDYDYEPGTGDWEVVVPLAHFAKHYWGYKVHNGETTGTRHYTGPVAYENGWTP